ncbi:helix-turn-helix domain-containing protein [Fictibacillus sp. 23RED33]|uniref:helix-turn-helix domain-containing protein n=1 Tax=Fictibacillus sp. 23RED33 TaxID=2745879 RepID=UPI0018CE5FF0|nr:helix-turn-helix transcriptional regulator [Fictibacillus sp. 23RED33]MBH0174747.1 helix-turn-helix domain-containing protein [Fictibacillus sp. 23RED33]
MIKNQLKKAREYRKLTQEELARKVNVTKGTISNYENGHSTPSNDMLNTLADVLYTTTDFLLGREDDIDTPNNPLHIEDVVGKVTTVNVAENAISLTEEELKVFNKIKEHPLLFHKLANATEKKIKALISMWEALETAQEDDDEDFIED